MSAVDDLQAIYGTNPMGLRTFPMSFTSTQSRTSAALVEGGYVLRATQDCWVKLGNSSVAAAAIAPTTTQPTSPNDTFKLSANVDKAITVPMNGRYLSVIRASVDGELLIEGPWQVQP